MNLRGNRTRDDPEINFIPLIDVLLVILIFLMVTTTYQRVAELQITLPEADADPAKQRPQEVNVGIDAQGRYVIDREPTFTFTSVDALADMLKRAAGDAKEPGRHHQRRREGDASVGRPRDGGRARGRPHPHHVRDAVVADRAVEVTPAPRRGLQRVWYSRQRDALTATLLRPLSLRSSAPSPRSRRALFRTGMLPRDARAGARDRRRQHHRRRHRQDAARRGARRGAARARTPSGHREPRLRRRDARSARRVAPDDDPRDVGDEPLLLAASGAPVWVGTRSRGRGARAARRASGRATSSSPTTACSTTRSRATSRSPSSTPRAASATGCCCRRDRCASRRRASRGRRGRVAQPRRRSLVDAVVSARALRDDARSRCHGINLRDPTRLLDARRAGRCRRVPRSPASAHPARFFAALRALGIGARRASVSRPSRVSRAATSRLPGARAILMTEKDAVKCRAFADARMWCLPVRARVDPALIALVAGEARWIPSCLKCSSARSPRARSSTTAQRRS